MNNGDDTGVYSITPGGCPSAYDPFTMSDVLNCKTHAITRGFQEAASTPPMSVSAVEAKTTIREALDELALSNIKSVPVRDGNTGVVLGFFDATLALRVALEAAGDDERERTVLEVTLEFRKSRHPHDTHSP